LHTLPALLSVAIASVIVGGCAGEKERPPEMMAKFNAALCPKEPFEDTSRPLDPGTDGAKAELSTPTRVVEAAGALRLALTLRNTGLHRLVLELPQQAFTLDGFQLVDHACRQVPYARGVAARALSYRTSGPIPLGAGESATLDSTLDGLAPGLQLTRGIYAIRLALRMEPSGPTVRGRTLYSDWTLFAVKSGY
jgi:hypothetical protein